MAEGLLPVEYHIEIYPQSFSADPTFHAQAASPFSVPNVGDHADSRGFTDASFASRRLRVADVEHLWWKIEGDHISHKLMIVLTETAED